MSRHSVHQNHQLLPTDAALPQHLQPLQHRLQPLPQHLDRMTPHRSSIQKPLHCPRKPHLAHLPALGARWSSVPLVQCYLSAKYVIAHDEVGVDGPAREQVRCRQLEACVAATTSPDGRVARRHRLGVGDAVEGEGERVGGVGPHIGCQGGRRMVEGGGCAVAAAKSEVVG